MPCEPPGRLEAGKAASACRRVSSLAFIRFVRRQAKGLLAVVFGVRAADRQRGREGSRLIHPQSPFAQGEGGGGGEREGEADSQRCASGEGARGEGRGTGDCEQQRQDREGGRVIDWQEVVQVGSVIVERGEEMTKGKTESERERAGRAQAEMVCVRVLSLLEVGWGAPRWPLEGGETGSRN